MNDEAEVRLLHCSEFAGYRWIVGNVVLVRAKHQGAATARGPVLILIKYHPGAIDNSFAGLDFDICGIEDKILLLIKSQQT